MTQSGSTRRRFLKTAGAASSLVTAGLATMSQPQAGTVESDDRQSCLDYRRSFICGTSEMNAVRFWIESRTTIVDSVTNESSVFFQCASCKSENTFGEKNLFLADNYDFMPILGDAHWLIFRRHAQMNPAQYRSTYELPHPWGSPRYLTHEGTNAQVLTTWEEIRDATAQGVPLVSQTELVNSESSLKAVIECPVKTMNISLEKQMYQVETGPIAFPDLTQKPDRLIDCLSLAFVAFNQNDFADFVIEQPTPVIEGNKEVGRVYHYSNPISLSATNRILTHE